MSSVPVYGVPKSKKLGLVKDLRPYCCGYCGYRFKQHVVKGGGQGEAGKRGDVSDQVRCRRCGNFLKTWD